MARKRTGRRSRKSRTMRRQQRRGTRTMRRQQRRGTLRRSRTNKRNKRRSPSRKVRVVSDILSSSYGVKSKPLAPSRQSSMDEFLAGISSSSSDQGSYDLDAWMTGKKSKKSKKKRSKKSDTSGPYYLDKVFKEPKKPKSKKKRSKKRSKKSGGFFGLF